MYAVYRSRAGQCSRFLACGRAFRDGGPWVVFEKMRASSRDLALTSAPKMLRPTPVPTSLMSVAKMMIKPMPGPEYLCIGKPDGGWGGLGVGVTTAGCKEKCEKDLRCKVAVYSAKLRQCSRFLGCSRTARSKFSWVVFEKTHGVGTGQTLPPGPPRSKRSPAKSKDSQISQPTPDRTPVANGDGNFRSRATPRPKPPDVPVESRAPFVTGESAGVADGDGCAPSGTASRLKPPIAPKDQHWVADGDGDAPLGAPSKLELPRLPRDAPMAAKVKGSLPMRERAATVDADADDSQDAAPRLIPPSVPEERPMAVEANEIAPPPSASVQLSLPPEPPPLERGESGVKESQEIASFLRSFFVDFFWSSPGAVALREGFQLFHLYQQLVIMAVVVLLFFPAVSGRRVRTAAPSIRSAPVSALIKQIASEGMQEKLLAAPPGLESVAGARPIGSKRWVRARQQRVAAQMPAVQPPPGLKFQ